MPMIGTRAGSGTVIGFLQLLLPLLIGATPLAAQAVIGRVTTTDTRTPLGGAQIILQGTNIGTLTRADGVFTINAPPDGRLVISRLGYATETIAINGRSRVDVQLQSTTTLQDVIAVPYVRGATRAERPVAVFSTGWLGLMLQESREAPGAMEITSVAANSPAAEADIRTGDRIVRWNGSEDASGQRARTSIAAGDTIRLRISRRGERDRDVAIVAAPRTVQAEVLRGLQGDNQRILEVMEEARAALERRAEEQRGLSQRNDQLLEELERVREQLERRGDLRFRVDTLRVGREGLADSLRTRIERFELMLPSLRAQSDSLRARGWVWRGGSAFPLDSIASAFPGTFYVDSVSAFLNGWRAGGGPSMFGFPPDSFRVRAAAPAGRAGLAYVLTAGRSGIAGAEFVDLTAGLGSYFGATAGALVVRVAPQTPAAGAGLREGDVVVRAGDATIDGVVALRRAIAAGRTSALELEVIRERERQTIQLGR